MMQVSLIRRTCSAAIAKTAKPQHVQQEQAGKRRVRLRNPDGQQQHSTATPRGLG